MSFSISDWIAIIGIIVASIIGIVTLLKKTDAKQYKISAKQNSGPFSKGKQKQNIKVTTADD